MKVFKLMKRWFNMLQGKSNFHVEQGKGKCYSVMEIKGYYNDLTNKVVSNNTVLDKQGIPVNTTIAGIQAYFPITIFQYALGLYDLYLLEKNEQYLQHFLLIANWAIKEQKENGMWDCMGKLNDKAHETQSSMCQSEGASVLLRAYTVHREQKYYETATKAIDFMIKSVEDGGTCLYEKEEIIFQEYVSVHNVSVLNGWIFSIFGLFDYTLINNDNTYKKILDTTVNSMAKMLKNYDRGFWSNYDLKHTIASPAYHDLHIRQLQLMYELFGNEEFNTYAKKWDTYQKSKRNTFLAMSIKLKQKLFKSAYYDINTSLVK